MGGLVELLKYSKGRNIAKIILLLWAVTISTFAMTLPFLVGLLHFDIGFEIRNWIALLYIPLFIFIKDDLIVTKKIPYLDPTLSKYAYYVILGLLAIEISSLSFPLLTNLLNLSFFGYPLIAIRNFIAILLLIVVRIIHISG